MAYDEALAGRIREALAGEGAVEKKAFGGLAFLVGGNMAISASGRGGAMVRCEPAATASLLEPGVTRMERGGKQMDGWLLVADSAIASDAELRRWAAIGIAYAKSLPPK
jgi:TfoX N-terminal domain